MEKPSRDEAPDPLETSAPGFSLEQALAISRRLFGVGASISALSSERDQNFRVLSAEGRSFLLKISNSADDLRVLEMQTEAMLHVARTDPELPVMRPLRSLEDAHHAAVEGAAAGSHFVRLFTFLPGRMMASPALDRAALGHFGSVVARMGVALRGFFHPAGAYRILWDLKHTPDLRPLLETITEKVRRDLVERVLDRFDARVRSPMPTLRAQLIHNDMTLDNVLLNSELRVTGIVDFGDLTHTAAICDLAIALVSVMWGRSDPLEASAAAIEGFTSVTAIDDVEADLLADLVAARLAALVLIANRRVLRYPDNAAYIMGNVDLAWQLLEQLDGLGWSSVAGRMAAACLRRRTPAPPRPRPSTEELLERRRRVLGPALSPLSYDRPLYLLRGEGTRMFDHNGDAYLDAYNNVPVVGHCHPRVIAAIAEQSSTLNTNTRYLHESVIELAERLGSTMPPGLDTVMFLNSGSEANDVAWRLATAYTEGSGGIVTDHAYHGVTAATSALSPEEWSSRRPEHIETIAAPDGYRGAHRREEQGWAERYAARVDEAVSKLRGRGLRPAALYVDPLYTSDGIFAPPADYLQDVLRRVRAGGCLLVADEVQCGFGRSGSHLWSFESSHVTPDLVTLGKPMGNGHPVAAVVTRAEIAERFASRSEMFSTFGGNPVACRAALAVLDVLESERLREHAQEVGRYLRTRLEALMDCYSSIGDVRGAGLLVGVELVRNGKAREPDPGLTHAVINHMRDHGVLVGSTGRDRNVIKIRPPLVLGFEEADLITQALDASLRAGTDEN
jgi:4-aminobutyrate aminotransferase-like enzyme/Ser/Thr protein kinase RdoA (MazF antagonist)